MRRAMRYLRRKLPGFRRREDGSSTVEFAILFPVFIAIFISSIESGLFMIRNVFLERGLDHAVREMRIGAPGAAETYVELRDRICNYTWLPDCQSNLALELTPVSPVTWTPLDTRPRCVNRAEPVDPATEPDPERGGNNEFMLVRVCINIDPIFSNIALGALLDFDDDNGYYIVATSAFVNEPSR